MKRRLTLVVSFLFLASLTAWSQDTANLVGSVTDSTSAVIPGAKVIVENSAKGFHRDLVSNAAGEFGAARIPIGDYVVSAEAPGFQKLVRSGIALAVGQTLRVDMQLTVGQVTQEVTVTGNVAKVETETAAISDVVTGGQIANMMMNGRNWVTLALLVPGASPDNGLDTQHVGVYGNNSISFNGSRTQYNNWEVDGGNNTDEGSAGTFNTYPSVDSIAEFRISTSNYGADMGKHAGATIELATKSGTKDFHGTVFEYLRNDHLDANPWFVNRAGGDPHAPKTPRKWNDYGYNFGGPFYIPGHYNTDKSKTFFFWSQNWRKYREGQVIGAGVPTALMRTGDFSECDSDSPNYQKDVASGCNLPRAPQLDAAGKVMKDPLTHDTLYNTYDTVQSMPGFDAAAFANGTALLDGLVPLPNNGPAGHFNNWLLGSSTATNWRQEQIRVDQNIGDNTRVFVRWTQDAWNTLAVPSLWAWANFDTIKTPFGGPGKSAVINITHSFKPTLMNEFVMSYTVDHILLDNQAGASSIAGINRTSGFALSHFFPANDGNPLLPGLGVCGGGQCWSEDAANHPWFNSNPIINWKDNVAWTHGKHTTKFGFFLQDYRKNEQFGADTQGYIYFNDGTTNSTSNALADMFLGRVNYYQEGTQTANGIPVGGYPKGHWVNHAFEPYIQDDWKVSRKLTLNLGLRFYYYTRIHDNTKPTVDSGFLPNQYDPTKEAVYLSDGTIDQSTGHLYTTFGNGLVECGANGIPAGCQQQNTWSNWAPRFGFAYDPWGDGKTVIRGGYGIYFELGNGNEAQTEGGEGNPPVALSPLVVNKGGDPDLTSAYDPVTHTFAKYSNGYTLIQPVFDTATGAYSAPLGPTGYTSIPYSQPWGSQQQFSLGMQHEFRGNNLLSVGYVGTLGRHLARNRNISQIQPGVGNMTVPALAGQNDYCDAQGVCDVQNALINNAVSSIFFQKYPGYNNMQVKENTAVSSYNSLQVNFRHAFGHGITFQSAYTWSHSIDDSSSTYHQNGQLDDYNLSRFKATSGLNRTHVLQLNYIYEMPFFKNSNALLKGALGGWQISGIGSFFTGQPIDFNCGISGYSTGIGGAVKCNSVGPVKVSKGSFDDPTYGPTPTWWDPSTITNVVQSQLRADNQAGMFGYMGRNALTGPGRNNWDMALLKNFTLPWFKGEHSTIQFRWETFNTWNHPQWNGVNAGCDGSFQTVKDSVTKAVIYSSDPWGRGCADTTTTVTDSAGKKTDVRLNSGAGQVNSAWPSRIMQFGLKFLF